MKLDPVHRAAIASHARRRLEQRCSITIDADTYQALCLHLARAIDSGAAAPELTARDRKPVYRVTLNGPDVFAVWSRAAELILTFYPELRWVVQRDPRRVAAEARA